MDGTKAQTLAWPRALVSWVRPSPLLAVILWGGVYPGARLGLHEIPVVAFTGLRIAIAIALLFAAAWLFREKLRMRRELWKPLLIAGLAQMAFQGLLVLGLNPRTGTTAGNSAILLAASPVLVAGWLALTRQERLARRQGWGLLLGLAGVGLVVSRVGLGLDTSHLSGDLVALAAAGAWAWYGLAIGPLVKALGALQATAWTMVIAGSLFIPLALAGAGGDLAWTSVSWKAWTGLIYGATAGMVVAMSLWGRSVHRLGPRQTMVYVYLEPISAVVIAAIVLSETLSPMQAAGAVVTFIGVWLASSRG